MSIDKFYYKIRRHILLLAAYADMPELEFIIKACRIKPLEILEDPINKKLRLIRHWIDEHSNSLKIIKNKRIRITLNDLSIDKSRVISTDLYAGLSLDKVAAISKLAFIFAAKDDLDDHCIISFLGLDDYLRTFVYLDGEWEQYPSLYLGMKVLKKIAKNKDIKYFLELNQKDTIIYPCTKPRAWLTSWPPHKDFISLLKEQDISALDSLIDKG